MDKKGILFDFFGVICSEVAEPWFEKNGSGMTYEAFRTNYIYPYDSGDISDEATWKTLATISGQTEATVKADWIALATVNTPVVDFIKQLNMTYQLALITNAGADFFWSILDANHIRDLFPVVVVSSEERIVKPDSRIYEIALQRMGLPAEAVLFIDDRVQNLKGAEPLGIQGLHFESLAKLKEDLAKLGVAL